MLKDLANAIRKGVPAPVNTGLPKEVQELLAERQQQKELEAEAEGFENDYGRLAATVGDEGLKDLKVKDRLLELAYSEEKAPDGEEYYKKPLYELYMKYVKPEIEPGKPSAEPSRGGSKSSPQVIDFQEIFDRDDPKEIEAMSEEQFSAFHQWLTDKQGDVPIRHAK